MSESEPKRVLIIDDVEVFAEKMKALLEAEGKRQGKPIAAEVLPGKTSDDFVTAISSFLQKKPSYYWHGIVMDVIFCGEYDGGIDMFAAMSREMIEVVTEVMVVTNRADSAVRQFFHHQAKTRHQRIRVVPKNDRDTLDQAIREFVTDL